MRLLRLFLAAKAAVLRAVPLMRDVRVPLPLKLTAAALALLVISPLDLFGDVPVLGALDDAALLALLCWWFVRLAERHVAPVPVRRSSPPPGSSLAIR
jgi:uncharacterized membrane protein YkvA (DUF1232 family)